MFVSACARVCVCVCVRVCVCVCVHFSVGVCVYGRDGSRELTPRDSRRCPRVGRIEEEV